LKGAIRADENRKALSALLLNMPKLIGDSRMTQASIIMKP